MVRRGWRGRLARLGLQGRGVQFQPGEVAHRAGFGPPGCCKGDRSRGANGPMAGCNPVMPSAPGEQMSGFVVLVIVKAMDLRRQKHYYVPIMPGVLAESGCRPVFSGASLAGAAGTEPIMGGVSRGGNLSGCSQGVAGAPQPPAASFWCSLPTGLLHRAGRIEHASSRRNQGARLGRYGTPAARRRQGVVECAVVPRMELGSRLCGRSVYPLSGVRSLLPWRFNIADGRCAFLLSRSARGSLAKCLASRRHAARDARGAMRVLPARRRSHPVVDATRIEKRRHRSYC